MKAVFARLTTRFVVVLMFAAPSFAKDIPAEKEGVDSVSKRCERLMYQQVPRIAACTKLLDLGQLPKNLRAKAHRNRVQAYLVTADRDRAIEDLNLAIALDPEFAEAYRMRGMVKSIYFRENDQAVADLDMAISLRPSFTSAYNDRANTFQDLGKYSRAIADYCDAIALDPNFVIALIQKAWLLSTLPKPELRDGKKAVKLAMRAIALYGRDDTYYLGVLAAAYAEAGEFSKAVPTEEKRLRKLRSAGKFRDVAWSQKRLELYRSERPYRKN